MFLANAKEILQNLKPSSQQSSSLQSHQAFSKTGDRARGILQRFPETDFLTLRGTSAGGLLDSSVVTRRS